MLTKHVDYKKYQICRADYEYFLDDQIPPSIAEIKDRDSTIFYCTNIPFAACYIYTLSGDVIIYHGIVPKIILDIITIEELKKNFNENFWPGVIIHFFNKHLVASPRDVIIKDDLDPILYHVKRVK